MKGFPNLCKIWSSRVYYCNISNNKLRVRTIFQVYLSRHYTNNIRYLIRSNIIWCTLCSFYVVSCALYRVGFESDVHGRLGDPTVKHGTRRCYFHPWWLQLLMASAITVSNVKNCKKNRRTCPCRDFKRIRRLILMIGIVSLGMCSAGYVTQNILTEYWPNISLSYW